MKLNLLVQNETDVIDGYLNLDHAPPNHEKSETCQFLFDLEQITQYVDLAEAEEVVMHDVIRYFREPAKTIEYVSRFVAKGGILVVNFCEFDEVLRAYEEKRLPLQELRNILYGPEIKSCVTIEEVIEAGEKMGWAILKKRITGVIATVVMRRPDFGTYNNG